MELSREFPRVITSSARASFSKCEQRFFNEVVLGLQSKGQTSVHLTAGAAYAAALEGYRSEYEATQDYDAAVARGLEALIKSYGPNDYEGETKTFDLVVAAFVEYLFNYPPGKDHVRPLKLETKAAIEFSFVFEIPEVLHPQTKEPLLFAGRFDQLVEYNGAIFVFDDKTTSSMGPLWRKQWDLRSQFTAYTVGALEHGYQVAGAIIRGMAILKTKCSTAEAITYRPAWLVERWRERLVFDCKRMIEAWHSNYWPHRGEESDACTSYGICPFMTLCTSHDPKPYYSVYYDVQRWDPIARERIRGDLIPSELKGEAK